MGGHQEIRIVGVTILDPVKTYDVYFQALPIFNRMIIGGEAKWTAEQRSVILKLIDGQNENIDKYILDSFALFVNNIVNITLDLHNLCSSDSEIVSNIMNKMGKDVDIDPFSESTSINLFRGDIIFPLFYNLQTMVIYSYNHPFSFSYLLSMISASNSLHTITFQVFRALTKIS